MHGSPKHAVGMVALPYVNPKAPKGGRLTLGVQGSFSSLNPLIYKGESPAGVREYVYESLMVRAADEPFSLYGHIAESIDVPEDRTSATFVIRPEARFSDGTPITADDALFSHTLLKEHGWPFMRGHYAKVTRAIKLSDYQIRFEFGAAADRELVLIIGLMPILPKARTNPETFEETSLVIPVGSGPYVISKVDVGRSVVYMRNLDWWARDLPTARGRFNFDAIRVEFFRDSASLFESFKAGDIDVLAEEDPTRWSRGYDFPAVKDGRVIKRELATALPAGMAGLVFNTRRPLFQDARVRAALIQLFDAEWVNAQLYGNLYSRTQSFFERSELSSFGAVLDTEERRLLAPFPDAVKPAIADGSYSLPKSPGTGANRVNQIAAVELLRAAGYELRGQRLIAAKSGLPLSFEVLITSQRQARLLLPYSRSLATVGITLDVRIVDSAQYEARLKSNDYDMIQSYWQASLSPGGEQFNRWGSASSDGPGTRNYAGVKSAAVDAMIDAIVTAREADSFRSAVRAFDRVLRSGDYVIPLFYPPKVWVAHWAHLQAPEIAPNSGFDLDTWWSARRTGSSPKSQ